MVNTPLWFKRIRRAAQPHLIAALAALLYTPFNNLRELIAYAKAHSGALTYGTPGAGSTTHLWTHPEKSWCPRR